MNKKIITQAFLFEYENPTNYKIKELAQLAALYQKENDVFFLYTKRNERAVIKNKKEFFKFISETQNINVDGFEDLHNLMSASTRAENITYSGNSKLRYIKVFDNVVIIKKKGDIPKLYQQKQLSELEHIKKIVAIENGESFLNVDNYVEKFTQEYFVYLGGYSNKLTREFLKTKDVCFFLDFDIESMNIYDGFECQSKTLHIPDKMETFFKNKRCKNTELYKKQRARMRDSYSKEASLIIKLIKNNDTVVEQEFIYQT